MRDWNFKIDKINITLKWLTISFALYYIIMFIVIAVSRLTFPFDVEWMEGGMVEHVFRILNSQPIYTVPSLEFIPYIYTPLYFYLSSWVSELTGIGFFPLRLVSFISTLSISQKDKDYLLTLNPLTYTGLASTIVETYV